ncbi:Sucrose-6-phosphate hydrolase [Kluyvera cryocrescens]|uniref:Sucrose-6-phosphate hydrolase n=2 Tax=Kluyvera cryocrescens TaxID=580 RepID=A0A485B787_KLUCR|nr:Sucrose-6-phosphate hydrolase [Kluyvera cryocrescens]
MPEQRDGWAGMLSLPREIRLGADNRLRMTPAEEVATLRGSYYPLLAQHLKNQSSPIVGDAEAIELDLVWDMNSATAESYGIALGEGLRIYVDAQAQRLVLERCYPQLLLEGSRSVPLPAADRLALRIFIDRSSVEVFVNEGESCLSSRIYPQEAQRQLLMFANNGDATLSSGGYWPLDK